MKRDRQAGVSLLNVLAVLAVGTGLVQVMLRDQDTALERLERANNAVQAQALAQGGVTSVAVALRRDFVEAPGADHLNEPWALAVQERITLDFGQFEVSVRDVRGRFDLNALHPSDLGAQRVFAGLLSALDLPELLAGQIVQIVSQHGPLTHPEKVLDFGIADSDLDRLRPHITTTDAPAPLNLNSVTEPVLAALLRNPSVARGLIARRAAKGFLEPRDFAALGVAVPALSGFTSDAFDVDAVATVDGARAVLINRLYRDPDTGTVHDTTRP